MMMILALAERLRRRTQACPPFIIRINGNCVSRMTMCRSRKAPGSQFLLIFASDIFKADDPSKKAACFHDPFSVQPQAEDMPPPAWIPVKAKKAG